MTDYRDWQTWEDGWLISRRGVDGVAIWNGRGGTDCRRIALLMTGKRDEEFAFSVLRDWKRQQETKAAA